MSASITVLAAGAVIIGAFCYALGYLHGLFRSYNIFDPKEGEHDEHG